METLVLLPGDHLRVRLPGDAPRDARLLRILDGRGRRLDSVIVGRPPPHAMLVVSIAGMLRCIPLWDTGDEAPELLLRAG